MTANEQCPELEQLEQVVRSVRHILAERAPQPLAEIEQHLQRLREQRWRIAVAGAQGNGKSSLVRALLASPEHPDPPVPVSDREETRIPVLYRKGRVSCLREVGKLGKREHLGPIEEEAIRKRASVDRGVFDSARYAALDALEVDLPGVALQGEIDLVDLPGVAGNLATVSQWAITNLLEVGSQAVIFVLSSSSTIEATQKEANLIRAFGPLMVRAVFVQNIWTAYDDDNDATEAFNLKFLRRHLGHEVHYVRLDIRAALDAARRGEPIALRPVLDALEPFYRRDILALSLADAGRLRRVIDEVLRSLAVDLLSASGNAEAARRAVAAIQAERERLSAALLVLTLRIQDEVEVARCEVRNGLRLEFDNFERALEEFVRDEKSLQNEQFEREVARQFGRLQHGFKGILTSAVDALQHRVREQSREVLGRIEVMVLPDADVQFAAPPLEFGLPRQILDVLKGVVRLGMGAGGAAVGPAAAAVAGGYIGVELGAWGGPVGMLAGLVAGSFVGWLSTIAIDQTAGALLTELEREQLRARLKVSVAPLRDRFEENCDCALDDVAAKLKAALQIFLDDREAVFLHQKQLSKLDGQELVKLAAERGRLNQARKNLDALLTRDA